MAEFVMLCPICNVPIIARTGLLAKKNIKCECGTVVPVEKMAEEKCPKCQNIVAYDRTKTYTPVCSKCKTVINVRARIAQAMNERQEKLFGKYTVNITQLPREDEEK